MITTSFHNKVIDALELLIKAGSCFQGMFPSFMTLNDFQPYYGLPSKLPGQRGCDRAAFGSNLMHDHIVLRLCYELARILDKPALADGADGYLEYFATKCTATPTGLFPWGEHAYWNIVENAPGNAWTHTEWGPRRHPLHHDHLRQAPLWLWEKLWQFNPECVKRFAAGLDNHWERDRPDGRVTFNRHAYINEWESYVSTSQTADFGFPRHAGFYIFDWSFVFGKTCDPEMRARIVRMLDHHWAQRNTQGLLPMHGRWNVRQTLSLAVSLFESAKLVEPADCKLAELMRERARVYADGFLTAQDELANGRLVANLPLAAETQKTSLSVALNRDNSGEGGGGSSALLCCGAYRLTGDQRFLDVGIRAARYFEENIPENTDDICPRECGMALGVYCDLAELTGDVELWRTAAEKVVEIALKRVWDNCLPRAHSSVDYYESQTMPGRLLYSAARAAFVFGKGESELPEDYTQR